MPASSSSSSTSGSSSSSSSSSSTSTSSDSNSSSASSKKKSTKKFVYSKSRLSSLTKWIVAGINKKSEKRSREMLRPSPKGKAEFLKNPMLDECFYQKLKAVKGSSASKPNIDPLEKIYRVQTYKMIDLARPLMYLMSRSKLKNNIRIHKTKSDSRAIRAALTLWVRLYGNILSARRRNILTQIYPNNTVLLDDKKIISAQGRRDLAI